ncbi:MAG TPA: proton-conducting transporter membrane subunit, partial [Pseudonocardia sp.]|nr:proton-conducting transporter membrane subunit [Pseudonocardia sp.]
MLLLVALHALVAALVVPVVARCGSRGFLLAAVPPLVAFGYLGWRLPAVLEGRDPVEVVPWVPGWGLDLAMRMDALSAAMTVLVAGVGALVMVYGGAYFAGKRPVRTASALVAFAGAMLGLVLADDLLLLYVFWELTTVCSFVLIAHDDVEREARRKATQALLTTTAGGLAMLLGFVVLGETAGTYRISELVAAPPAAGPAVTFALACVLLGAFAKSAQVPFHGWLPAAMVAPTPVSAYLHAAAMVNAGIYLVARLAPAFAEVPLWRPAVLTAGVATLLVGGWRAFRQTDLKRLLAFSTVSQLGLLMILLGEGGRTAELAGVALLLAHGLAKAGLFFVAGAIDQETGTRDIRRLSGLRHRAPALAVLTALCAASLAAIPVLLGWAAKESAYEAFVHGGVGARLVLAGIVVGSAFTLAYALRLVISVFGGPTSPEADVHGTPWGLAGPVVPLAAASLVLGVWTAPVDALAAAWADRFPVLPGGDPEHHIEPWHGLTPAFGLSLLTLALGTAIHLARRRVDALQDRVHAALPAPLDVDRGYEGALTGLRRVARAVTVTVQVGSPPVYLLLIGATAIVLPGSALVVALAGSGPAVLAAATPWNTVAELGLAVLVLAAAVATVLTKRRLATVLMLGFVGYGVAGLFTVRYAPDLALTQLLVETLTLVAFVLVLRRLPEQHPDQRP